MTTKNYKQNDVWVFPAILGAAADLAPQKFVYLSSEGTVTVSTATTGALGLVNDWKASPSAKAKGYHEYAGTADDGNYEVGDQVPVLVMGIGYSKVESGKSVTVDDKLEVGANGYVQPLTDPSHQCVGKALASATSTNEVKILVNCTNIPTSTEEFSVQSLATDTAITFTKVRNVCQITKGSAVAATLAAPTADEVGHTIEIVDQGGYAHGITIAAPGLNGNTSYTVYTFTGNKGDSLRLKAMNAATPYWAVESKLRTNTLQTLTDAGAITIKPGVIRLNKGAGFTATLADPAWCNDGDIITIFNMQAYENKVDNSAGSGFYGLGGSYDVATLPNAIGNYITIQAHSTKWYPIGVLNGTIAGS